MRPRTEDEGLDAELSRRPLRIAQINDIAAVASALARAMTELGEEATVIEPRRLGAGLRYPWKIASLPFRAAGILGAGMSVRGGHYDVVHVHYARLGMIGAMTGRPFTLHVHGTDIRGVRPGSFWGRETAPYLRRARLVYYSTPDLEEWIRPFRDDAVFLPNPIEVDLFRPLAPDDPARAARRDLLVGVRLAPIKGLPAILETIRILTLARPATTITVVAQGERAAAARALAGPNIAIMPRVPRGELPDLFRGHRLALGQFLVGAIGNYELEALSAGVPVVMRFDREAAYPAPPPLVSVAGAEQAAARICELLDDQTALDELAGRGPAWVAANHAARTVAARVIADYRRTGQAPS